MHLRIQFFLLFVVLVFCRAGAQLPTLQVQRIHEEGGLKTGDILNTVRDRKGFLWIATQNAVQQFDGREAARYSFPESVVKVLADSAGLIWAQTRANIYRFDRKKRAFLPMRDKAKGSASDCYLFDGAIEFMSNGSRYRFDPALQQFKPVGSDLHRFHRFFGQRGHRWFGAAGDSVFLVDESLQKTYHFPLSNIAWAFPVSNDQLLVSNTRFKTFLVDLVKGEIIELNKSQGSFLSGLSIIDAVDWKPGVLLMAGNKGLCTYDIASRSISPLVVYNEGRPFENNASTTSLLKDGEGNVFLNHTDGLFLLNGRLDFIHHLRSYRWEEEALPSANIRNLAEDAEGYLWLATTHGLARLDPKTGRMRNFSPPPPAPQRFPSYRQLLRDGPWLWIGTSGNGVWRYHTAKGTWQRPRLNKMDKVSDSILNNLYVWELKKLPDGRIWAVGGNHSFLLGTDGKAVLQSLQQQGISRTATVDADGKKWHGTTSGLAVYDSSFQFLFSIKDSLPDKRVAAFCEWRPGRMLVGSLGLFEVTVAGRSLLSFRQVTGIPSTRFIYCMQQDRQGLVWVGTDDGLYRYDPVTGEAVYFGAAANVQSQAFNSDGAYLSSDGTMYLGGKNGLNYFRPEAYHLETPVLQPEVFFAALNGSDSALVAGSILPFYNPGIDLVISVPEFRQPYRLLYRYRLSEHAPWINIGFNNRVSLAQLPPGTYGLQVSARLEEGKWFDSAMPLQFRVRKAWWQTTLFRLTLLTALIFLFWTWHRYRNRRMRQRELKQTIDYFRYELPAGTTVDSIAWDIARNCITHLQLEDCVIYLLDSDTNVLVQKAALGAKIKAPFQIINPIVIPVGKGITGAAAQLKQTVIVNDTSKDSRYILDDEQRFSEIAVPILHQGRLLGVIDSEHRKKHFFRSHHRNLLETIASLCASRMATALALQALQQSQHQLQHLNGRMQEAKFSNLRLQMNPHFLFNILTSIQYLIVSGQVEKATRYLDYFSGFLRSLLDHAEDTVVTLEDELRILKLYVALESLSVDETFDWKIDIDDAIDPGETMVPFMLLQPFVENAIHHGLLHKVGAKSFYIRIANSGEESFVCTIEDNGVGRVASARINEKKLTRALHQSKGIAIVQQRMELLQQKTGRKASLEVEDLPQGTRIRLTIPYYQTEEV